ncbi:hypothetical protein DV736_g4187, partial [Chaetothyriales sp. CBS 134916]
MTPKKLSWTEAPVSSMSSFYCIFLPTIDPLIALSGVIANTVFQPQILNSYNSSFPADSEHVPIEAAVALETVAGFLLGIMSLQIVLLRLRWDDLTVWRCVEFSILVVDIVMLLAIAKALDAQGRLWDVKLLRVEEWVNCAILGGVALIRIAFLAGVGAKNERKARVE